MKSNYKLDMMEMRKMKEIKASTVLPLMIGLIIVVICIGLIVFSYNNKNSVKFNTWADSTVIIGKEFVIKKEFSDNILLFEAYSNRNYTTYVFKDYKGASYVYVTVSTDDHKIIKIARQLIF